MQSKATTVENYLAELPEDRRHVVAAVRDVIVKNLPEGYAEGMSYGMIGYCVPHAVYPPGYHCDPRQPLPFAGLAAQKNHYAVYLFCIYGSETETARFQKEWLATGKKLDMGKGCVRFKKLEDVPLDVLGRAIARVPVDTFIELYESNIKNAGSKRSKPAGATAAKKSSTAPSRAAKTAAAPKKTTKKIAKAPTGKVSGTASKAAGEKSSTKKPAAKVAKKTSGTATKKAATKSSAR